MTATEQREQYWQHIIAECQASGLSGMAFCKQQEIAYHQFTYWRSKFRQVDPNQPSNESGFARVMLASSGRSGEQLTLTLPSGISITGLHGENVELLGSILRQL